MSDAETRFKWNGIASKIEEKVEKIEARKKVYASSSVKRKNKKQTPIKMHINTNNDSTD